MCPCFMAAAPARRDVGMNGAAAVHPFTTALLTAGDISGQPAASQPSARPPFRDEPSAEAMRMNRKKGKGLGPCGKLGRPAWEGVGEAEYENRCKSCPSLLSWRLFSLSISLVPQLLQGSCKSSAEEALAHFCHLCQFSCCSYSYTCSVSTRSRQYT